MPAALKLMQYIYSVLPITGLEFLQSNKPHVFYNRPRDDQSRGEALLAASRFDRVLVMRKSVQIWGPVVNALTGQVFFEPGNEGQ